MKNLLSGAEGWHEMKGRTKIWSILACALAVGLTFAGATSSGTDKEEKMTHKKLTPDEERVIVHKGTEMPFSGKYYSFNQDGTYTCKRCGAELYRSADKFDAECGWPSFDDEVHGAVKHIQDADGMRTEITCAKCGAHLGHVFEGEGFTLKNVRHCVNSISLDFVASNMKGNLATANTPAPTNAVKTATAYFAGGCFWGTEHFLQKADGVISVRVGYMGGHTNNPTYRQVCDGTTGHAETAEVVFDPGKTDFEKLARLFFEIHDPTQVNRQGPDIGNQYRSAIYYVDDLQQQTTEKLISLLMSKGYQVVTEVAKAGVFWAAEDYHQNYYENTGKQPYCHFYQKRF